MSLGNSGSTQTHDHGAGAHYLPYTELFHRICVDAQTVLESETIATPRSPLTAC